MKRPLARAAGPWLCALLGAPFAPFACSYTFDDQPPDIPLVGEPPDMSRFPRLNRAPVDDAYIVYGIDNMPWAVLLEPGDLIRVHRLVDPVAEEELHGSNIFIRGSAFYTF